MQKRFLGGWSCRSFAHLFLSKKYLQQSALRFIVLAVFSKKENENHKNNFF